MNPDTRMATSLLLSLALSASNLRMAATGDADIVVVGLRYLAGFVLCFVLVGIIGRLFNAYLNQSGLHTHDVALAGVPALRDEERSGDRVDGGDQALASSDT